jgi:hypothetical protein
VEPFFSFIKIIIIIELLRFKVHDIFGETRFKSCTLIIELLRFRVHHNFGETPRPVGKLSTTASKDVVVTPLGDYQ